MPEGFYDPNNRNAFERYMQLVRYAAEQGMSNEGWFLRMLEQLNLFGVKGNLKLEDKIFQTLHDKAIARDANSAIYIFEKPSLGASPTDGVSFGKVFAVLDNNILIDDF